MTLLKIVVSCEEWDIKKSYLSDECDGCSSRPKLFPRPKFAIRAKALMAVPVF